MARRRANGVSWIVVLAIMAGAYNLLAPHGQSTTPTDNDVIATPLVSPPIASPPAEGQPSTVARPKVLYVIATTLNVRATPSASGTVLLAASRGTSVIAISQKDGWYEVRLTNGSTGWMSAAYLSETPPQKRAPVVTPPSTPAPLTPRTQIDRATIVQAVIADSIASYRGNCPCPYNTDRAGRSCGRRSAWSKPGGASPLCYPSDVSEQMIAAYMDRRRN